MAPLPSGLRGESYGPSMSRVSRLCFGSMNSRQRVSGRVCPQAASHLASAVGERLGAAEKYVRTKCGRQQTEERGRKEGVIYPMIFESFGEVSGEAERVIKSLNKAVGKHRHL